jgi:hypothetical protein
LDDKFVGRQVYGRFCYEYAKVTPFRTGGRDASQDCVWTCCRHVVGNHRCCADPARAGRTRAASRGGGCSAHRTHNFIKPDKTADFEAVIAKLKEALQKSEKPERKQQAASWKVFKSPDPAAGGNVLYVFIIEPSIKGADYTVSTILNEAFPQEVQALYKQYAEAYASGQNFVNLTLVSDFGK